MSIFNFFKKKPEDTDKLNKSLDKTSLKIMGGLTDIFTFQKKINDELFAEIEELLITSDIAYNVTAKILEDVRAEAKRGELKDVDLLTTLIKKKIVEIISIPERQLATNNKPYLILVIGVNGVGKTTTIAKLANNFIKDGKKVLLAAGDTFRAAATEQLTVWAERLKIDIIKQPDGSDPASVIYDGIVAAKSRGVDILLADTAGRLHNKNNLMMELKKIEKVSKKDGFHGFDEKLLVIDATSGQNAITQAKVFDEAIGITGIILTKLDGTAKGGMIISIIDELKIPIRFIGTGETLDDIEPFDPQAFADAIFLKK